MYNIISYTFVCIFSKIMNMMVVMTQRGTYITAPEREGHISNKSCLAGLKGITFGGNWPLMLSTPSPFNKKVSLRYSCRIYLTNVFCISQWCIHGHCFGVQISGLFSLGHTVTNIFKCFAENKNVCYFWTSPGSFSPFPTIWCLIKQGPALVTSAIVFH